MLGRELRSLPALSAAGGGWFGSANGCNVSGRFEPSSLGIEGEMAKMDVGKVEVRLP